MLLWYWGRRGGGARITLELARTLALRTDVQLLLAVAHGNELIAELHELGAPIREDYVHPPRVGVAWLPGPWSLGAWARGQGADIVVQVMGHPLSWPTASTVHRADVAFIDFVHDATPHPGDAAWAYDLSIARARRSADRLVALSEHVRAELVGSGVAANRTAVIPHGPLFDGMLRTSLPVGDPLVLFFGRIRSYKGIDLLLAAWPAVVERVPKARLRIAGEGSLEVSVAGLSRVEVSSRWFNDAEVPAVVGAASVVVLPYKEASQSGVVTIARSLGVPVVATRVGGLREQVRDGVDGLLCEPSPAAIADAIVRVLQDPGALSARQRSAEAAVSWGDVAEQLVLECRVVLNERRA